tara:strand:+ start:901 stop:1194 length:294 start_codon:yes stop_codon:yes gene_type:complete
MEAWELAYVNRKMEIPVAKESHSGCSAITVTQFGKSKEQVEERYRETVDEDKRISEPEYREDSRGHTVQWTERACLEPKTSGAWKKSNQRYRMSANK